jgi:hypothetical protein
MAQRKLNLPDPGRQVSSDTVKLGPTEFRIGEPGLFKTVRDDTKAVDALAEALKEKVFESDSYDGETSERQEVHPS